MKNKTYPTVGTIPKSNIEIVKKCKSTPITHKNITAHFLVLVQARQ